MPTYVYKFIDTGETIEVQQAFTDDALTHAKHPATGKKMKVKKVFTPVGVTFKGGGFYKTDSRGGKSKSSSTTPSTDSSASSTSSTSSSSSSDTAKSSDSGSTSATPTASPSTPAKTASTSD
jgi:predicted nucleic acid-binding Zn ribbon protein